MSEIDYSDFGDEIVIAEIEDEIHMDTEAWIARMLA